MILDILMTGFTWSLLAALFTHLAHLPWCWALILSLGLLWVYDSLQERYMRVSDPGAGPAAGGLKVPPPVDLLGTADVARHLVLFLVAILLLAVVLVVDVDLQAGGARLALRGLSWPDEMRTLLAWARLPESLSLSLFTGIVVSVVNVLGALALVHQMLRLVENIPRMAMILRGRGQATPPPKADPLPSPFVPALFVAIISLVLYAWLLPQWTYPMARLEVAHQMWPADFEPIVTGEGSDVAGRLLDFNEILAAHRGEFSARLLTNLPAALIAMHLLAACFLELQYSQLLSALDRPQRRHWALIRLTRWAVGVTVALVWAAMARQVPHRSRTRRQSARRPSFPGET